MNSVHLKKIELPLHSCSLEGCNFKNLPPNSLSPVCTTTWAVAPPCTVNCLLVLSRSFARNFRSVFQLLTALGFRALLEAYLAPMNCPCKSYSITRPSLLLFYLKVFLVNTTIIPDACRAVRFVYLTYPNRWIFITAIICLEELETVAVD